MSYIFLYVILKINQKVVISTNSVESAEYINILNYLFLRHVHKFGTYVTWDIKLSLGYNCCEMWAFYSSPDFGTVCV